MTTLITGATGYLGSYVLMQLLRDSNESLLLLVRAKDERQCIEKLWHNMQLHMAPAEFRAHLPRVRFAMGDLTAPQLGLDSASRQLVLGEADSVLHIAASLNRASERACTNVNLRGTLSVIRLARAIADARGLRRFSYVSTVAVAGERKDETVTEDAAIDWARRDYDPYGRTKKFCEHMLHELLPDVSKVILRPSMVIGDARSSQTTQFDMVRAVCFLADLPAIPLAPTARQDIVNADFVGKSIAMLHLKAHPRHEVYHLSAGQNAKTAQEIAAAIGRDQRFVPGLEAPFRRTVWTLSELSAQKILARSSASYVAALLHVFLPYVTYNTVFDNQRVTDELGIEPVPFTEYCAALYRYAKDVDFKYPHSELPAAQTNAATSEAASPAGAEPARTEHTESPAGVDDKTRLQWN